MARLKKASCQDALTPQAAPLCDISGCPEEGVYSYEEQWLICRTHFNAYLQGYFDLNIYFQIKKDKRLGIVTDLDALVEFNLADFYLDEDE